MANINEILARAAALRDETALNSIDPERAGGIMYDTLIALNELWLQQGAALVISKIYASVAAMNADTSPVSDLTGKPIRPGMIVVIASSDSDNGSVYRYNGTAAPRWSMVGSIGNVSPVDSLDSDSAQLPLAARQGKVLDGKISQLGQEIKGLNFGLTLNKYRNNTGGVDNANGWIYTDIVPITSPLGFSINPLNSRGFFFINAICYDESDSFLGVVPLGDKYNDYKYECPSSLILSFFPGAKKVAFNLNDNTSTSVAQEDISDLNAQVTGISTITKSINDLGLPILLNGVTLELIRNRYINTSGNIANANGWIATKRIEVSKDSIYKVDGANALGMYFINVACYSSSGSYLGAILLGDKYTEYKKHCTGEQVLAVYPTAEYIAFNLNNGGSSSLSPSDIADIQVRLMGMNEKIYDIECLKLSTRFNGFSFSLTLNKYRDLSTGVSSSANGWIYTDIFTLSEDLAYELNEGNALGMYFINASCFSETMQYLGAVILGDRVNGYKYRCFGTEVLAKYPSAKYIAFNLNNGTSISISDASDLSVKMVGIEHRISSVENEIFLPFIGKKWIAIGDSLTEYNQRTSQNYADYIVGETGMTFVNMGVGGSGYRKRYDENYAFYQRVNSIATDADVITIFGSFNDMSVADYQLGTPDSTDVTTICGCVNTTLDTIISKYITAGKLPKIGVITPTPWEDYLPSDTMGRCALYCDAIIECCRRKSIPVLDLFRCSNLHPENATFRALAYSKDGGSGVHPDEQGHKLIYPMILEFIKSLISYQ